MLKLQLKKELLIGAIQNLDKYNNYHSKEMIVAALLLTFNILNMQNKPKLFNCSNPKFY